MVGQLEDATTIQSYIFATCPPLGATDHNTTWLSAITKSPSQPCRSITLHSYIPVIHVDNIQVNDLNKSIATEHLCTVIEFDVSMTLIPVDTWNSNPIGCCHCIHSSKISRTPKSISVERNGVETSIGNLKERGVRLQSHIIKYNIQKVNT